MSDWHEVEEDIYVEIPIKALKKKGSILKHKDKPKEEVGVEEIEGVLQLRYFKLMHPNIKESDANIVAKVLAKSLLTNFSIRRRG